MTKKTKTKTESVVTVPAIGASSASWDGASPRVLVLGHLSWEIEDAGGMMVYMSNADPRAEKAADHPNIHALVLTGGQDISSDLYGAKPHPRAQRPHESRDLAELYAVQAAADRGIPVLGICRGAQMMNVAFGGTLHQHLPDLKGSHSFHQGHSHRVRAATGSRLRSAFRSDEAWVTSIHHQAADRIAQGFVATAWGLDGIVEAIESVEDWMLGVQFHPEIDSHKPQMRRIFEHFVAAAAKKAGLPKPTPRERPVVVKVGKKKDDKKFERGTSWAWGWGDHLPDDGSVATSVVTAESVKSGAQLTLPAKSKTKKASNVVTKWMCFRCDIVFEGDDAKDDHADHMFFLHDVDLETEAPKRGSRR